MQEPIGKNDSKLGPFLAGRAEDVAAQILGSHLVREINGKTLVGKIVETEAYDYDDAASHSYRGQTARNSAMFGPAGFSYVYFTYGMHYCFNIVAGAKGEGRAVLIRALEPLEGLDTMRLNRKQKDIQDLCSGPAKLCQALSIDKALYGHDLAQPPLRLIINKSLKPSQIVRTTRIGITKDMHRKWRFYVKNNSFVSKT